MMETRVVLATIKNFFLRKITIFKWQLNLFAFICISLGIVIGSYIGITNIIKIFGASDTYKTWTFNSANASQYTYSTDDLIVDDSGLRPKNKINNNTFDSNFDAWTYIQTYILKDDFTTPLSAGNVNNTQAEPTGGTRTVVDTENKLSITNGTLSFAGGKTSPAYGDPSIWYPSFARTPGRVLIFELTSSPTAGNLRFGFAPTSGSTQTIGLRTSGSDLKIRDTASDGSTVASTATSTSYKIAFVFRSTGHFIFLKGGAFTNWIMIWNSDIGTITDPFPASVNYNLIYTHDYISVPDTIYFPRPVISDGFSGNTSDGLGHAEGVSGQASGTGGDGYSWTGDTWTVSGGKASNTPTLGNEAISNGSMETGTPPTGWSGSGSAILTSYAEERTGGSGSVSLSIENASDGAMSYGYQDFTTVAGNWYKLDGWFKNINNNVGVSLRTSTNTSLTSDTVVSSGVWTNVVKYARATTTTTRPLIQNATSWAGREILADDVSIKPLAWNTLIRGVNAGIKDAMVEANLTVAANTQAGLVINLDSVSNPQNFILVYLDRDNNKVVTDKYVNGTFTNISGATAAVTYVAGAKLKVSRFGNAYYVYYNGAIVGSGQIISDLSVINNTLFGIFDTAGNTIDNFVVWNKYGHDVPDSDLTPSIDTSTKYSGAGALKLVASTNAATFVQTVDLGTSSTYSYSALVKTDGSAVTTSDVELYFNGSTLSSVTYTAIDNDWYRLHTTFTNSGEKQIGFKVKANKTVYIDDVQLIKTGSLQAYTTTSYSNAALTLWDSFEDSKTTPGTTSVKYQFCTDEGSTCESQGTWKYYNGSSWTTASNLETHVNSADQLTTEILHLLPVDTEKLSIKAILQLTDYNYPTLNSSTIGLITDILAPDLNADEIHMERLKNGTEVPNEGWTKEVYPYFEWTAGGDAPDGTGPLKGYCLYLGQDPDGDPEIEKGILGTSPESIDGSTCQFIVSTPYIDFSENSVRGNTWLTASSSFYYLKVLAIDSVNKVYEGDPEVFTFKFDNTSPSNTSYISCTSGNFSNVADMSFSWPTSGGAEAQDAESNILGWQYQINSNEGTWLGTSEEAILGVGKYIPSGTSTLTLTQERDGESINTGNNIVYFRSINNSGKPSSDASMRTCNLSFGGNAPVFGGSDKVTITPGTSTSNQFALSWPEATASAGKEVTHYYYMVNTLPPTSLATLQSNSSTYIDNGTQRSISTTSLPNVNKTNNTVYVVAIDDSDPANYSPSNYIFGTFVLNSSNPDNVGDLSATDSSIKSKQQWNVTLTWTEPEYKGAGNLTYLVNRSEDGNTFSLVGSSTGLSFVDTVPESKEYFYKIYTQDGARAESSGTNAVNITPTGKWTSPAELESDPFVSSITTKKATITWSTNRSSDSKISYGTKPGEYEEVEPSNSSQLTAHSIQLIGLNPDTRYYFKAKWTDEDGNTGVSEEFSFKTEPAPIVKNVKTNNIGLTSAISEFTVKGATKVKIYYGKTLSFGGVQEISTSPIETTYTAQLTELEDGTKYYFKINALDVEGYEYDGTVLDFTTLPRPRISNIQIQQVANTAQTTLLVSWETNTEVSSIVTYYPENDTNDTRDEVKVALEKGSHSIILRGLYPETKYALFVKGRDRIGNEAISDKLTVTTATDTRPPILSSISVEGSVIPKTVSTAQESYAQLVVSWNTDEPATSQVEYSEGTGNTYSQRTQEDSNLTYNHIVIISGLTPSKVYHLRAISKDKVNNKGISIDTVTIAPKATDNALNLVISNLEDIFNLKIR